MKIHYWDNPQNFDVTVAFVAGEGHVLTVHNFATGKEYPITDHDPFPKGCLMQIPRNLWQEMLKEFAEIANGKGIKLESDLKREGQLEATVKHLEDMRRLVFEEHAIQNIHEPPKDGHN